VAGQPVSTAESSSADADRTATDRVGPIVITSLVGAGLATLAIRNPNVSGSYGFCPFKALTGVDCPFCGGLRGTYALLHGDFATAINHNLLLPLMLVALAVVLAVWWRGSLGPITATGLTSRWAIVAAVTVLVVFWVLRALPALPYLASSA